MGSAVTLPPALARRLPNNVFTMGQTALLRHPAFLKSLAPTLPPPPVTLAQRPRKPLREQPSPQQPEENAGLPQLAHGGQAGIGGNSPAGRPAGSGEEADWLAGAEALSVDALVVRVRLAPSHTPPAPPPAPCCALFALGSLLVHRGITLGVRHRKI